MYKEWLENYHNEVRAHAITDGVNNLHEYQVHTKVLLGFDDVVYAEHMMWFTQQPAIFKTEL
jgi:hypothetical protein